MKEYITKNFTKRELACRCGQCLFYMDSVFMGRLQRIRDTYGKPMVINSAYRCPAHNKKIGGHHSSQHMMGRACDISVGNEKDKNLIIRLARQENMTSRS